MLPLDESNGNYSANPLCGFRAQEPSVLSDGVKTEKKGKKKMSAKIVCAFGLILLAAASLGCASAAQPTSTPTQPATTPTLSAESYYDRALEYARKGELDKALAEIEQAIQLKPDFAAAYRVRGNLYDDKGNLDRALADYDQAIKLAPKDAANYYDRGLLYQRKSDFDRALTDYSMAIELQRDYRDPYCNRGRIYAARGNLDAAILDLDQCVNLNPTEGPPYYYRGLLHVLRGDIEQAKADLRKFVQTSADASSKNQAEELLKGLEVVPSLSPSNLDGIWTGITSQGKAFQLTVKNGIVPEVMVEFDIAGCESPFRAINPQGQYSGTTFSLSSLTFSMTGTFSSGISASGRIITLCGRRVDFSWYASRNQ